MAGYVNTVRAIVCSELPATPARAERQAISAIFENSPLAISSHLTPL